MYKTSSPLVSYIFSSVNIQWTKRHLLVILIFPYHISKAKLLVTITIERLFSPDKAREKSMWRSFSYDTHLCTGS